MRGLREYIDEGPQTQEDKGYCISMSGKYLNHLYPKLTKKGGFFTIMFCIYILKLNLSFLHTHKFNWLFIIENPGLIAVFIDITIQIRIRFGMVNLFNAHLRLKKSIILIL